MSWSPSCCWHFMNKGIFLCLPCSASSRNSLQIWDYQNRAFSVPKVLPEHPVPLWPERSISRMSQIPIQSCFNLCQHMAQREGNSPSSTTCRCSLYLLPFCFFDTVMLLYTQGNGIPLLSSDPEILNSSVLAVPLTKSQNCWIHSFFTIPWKHLFTQTMRWWLTLITLRGGKCLRKYDYKRHLAINYSLWTKSFPALLCPKSASSGAAAQWSNFWHSQSSSWNSSVWQALRKPKPAHGGLLVLRSCTVEMVCWFSSRKNQPQTKMLSFYTLKMT